MKKNSQRNRFDLTQCNRLDLMQLAAAAAALSILEAIMIIAGVLPPVTSYSPGNLLFSLAKIAIVAYAGIVYAKEGLKKAASKAAAVAFVAASTLVLASMAGKAFFGKAILGLPAQNMEPLLLLVAIVIANTVLGAVVGAAAAWLAGKRG